MLARLSLCFTIIIVCYAGVITSAQDDVIQKKAANELAANCSANNETFDLKNEQFINVNCQPQAWNSSLNISVTAGSSLSGIVIDIRSGSMSENDKFEVFDITDSNKTVKLFDTYGESKTLYVTGSKNIRIIMTRGKGEHGFNFKIKPVCHFDNGSLHMPKIPKGATSLPSVKCEGNITIPYAMSFDEFKLSNKSYLSIDGIPERFGNNFTAASPPRSVILVEKSSVVFNIDLTDWSQNLSVSFTRFSGSSECGKKSMLTVTEGAELTIKPTPSSGSSIQCYWLISAPVKEQYLTPKIGAEKLKLGTSILSILDGGTLNSPVIMSASALDRTKDLSISSGDLILVTFISETFNDTENAISVTVSAAKKGGRYHTKGSIDLSGDGDNYFFLETDLGSIIVLNLVQPMSENSTIKAYSDFSTSSHLIASFTKNSYDLYSVSNRMLVVTNGLKGYNTSFSSIPADSNCYATFIYPSQSKIHVNNKTQCPPMCTWLIPPSDADMNLVTTLHMNGATNAKVYTQNNSIAYNLESDVRPFSFSAHSSQGLRINFDCQNGSFAMSYVMEKEENFEVELDVNQNVSISSPFYPASYPVNVNHVYKITPKSKSVQGFYLAFSVFDVPAPSALEIDTQSLSGSANFPDQVVPAGKFNGVFKSLQGSISAPKTGFGFLGSVFALECGGTVTEANKNVTTKDYPNVVKEKTCVWIFKLPKPEDKKDEGVSLNATIVLGDMKQVHPMNLADLNNTIKVYDGDSIMRSPLKTNVTNGETFQASSNTIIVVYTPSGNITQGLNIHMQQVTCSKAERNMCLSTQTCILPSWRCNGVPDCSDASDEMNCDDPHPAPTPDPVITGSGYKAAFWICVPLGIILGAIFASYGPAMFRKIREARYQQFHDLPEH